MPEPITLAVVGTIALTEGVKFFYGQAGEVLKRWRERRDAAKKAEASSADAKAVEQTEAAQPAEVKLPEVFEGQMASPKIDFEAVEKLEEPIRELRKQLSGYVDGTEAVDTADEKLLQNVDALRRALEAVYQQRLTFKGEKRPASGPAVEGRIDVETVRGYVAGVVAETIYSGNVTADVEAKEVEQGGRLIGVHAKNIGSPPEE